MTSIVNTSKLDPFMWVEWPMITVLNNLLILLPSQIDILKAPNDTTPKPEGDTLLNINCLLKTLIIKSIATILGLSGLSVNDIMCWMLEETVFYPHSWRRNSFNSIHVRDWSIFLADLSLVPKRTMKQI